MNIDDVLDECNKVANKKDSTSIRESDVIKELLDREILQEIEDE